MLLNEWVWQSNIFARVPRSCQEGSVSRPKGLKTVETLDGQIWLSIEGATNWQQHKNLITIS